MKVKFTPLGDRILAKATAGGDIDRSSGLRKEGGLFVPAGDESTIEATVYAVGKKVEDVKPGDHLHFSKFAGTEIKLVHHPPRGRGPRRR